MADAPTIFISYAGPDRSIAVALHAALLTAGLRPWCDAVDLRPGDRWDEFIPRFLERSTVVAVLISERWPTAGEEGAGYYGLEEVAIAIERSRRIDTRTRLVPIRLDGADAERTPYGLRRIADVRVASADLPAMVAGILRSLSTDAPKAHARPKPEARLDTIKRRISKLKARQAPADELQAAINEKNALKRTLRAGGRLAPGDVLSDRYVLGQFLGSGGFASVWSAWDETSERFVAVKVLHGRWNGDASRIERFFRGARQMAGLEHPGVVRVYEAEGRCAGWHFFVMELLAGGNLRVAITRPDAPLSVDSGLRALATVAEALAVAHSRGAVHRDIKPANILLGADGRARLTDFDLVRVADSTGGTATGALGTFLYAAPEQLDRPQHVGPRADVYGLGMTAVFVLNGSPPPTACKWRPEETVDALPATAELRALLGRAIALDAAERQQDANAFATELRAAIDRDCKHHPPPGRVPATEHRPALVPIAPGTFTMGSPPTEAGRDRGEASHPVHITRGFWMGETPVTQAQYESLTGCNPSRLHGGPDDGERPVENVTWLDVVSFCNRLSASESRSPAYTIDGHRVSWASDADGYRLPTEAEWEYACRASTTAATYAGDLDIIGENDAPGLEAIAWYGGNSGSDHAKSFDSSDWPEKARPHHKASSHPVGLKAPNPWGLYDMLGNVYEWCQDWHAAYPEPVESAAPVVDPSGPPNGTGRVIRGGSWRSRAHWCRSAYRYWGPPHYRVGLLGFRLVRCPRTTPP